MVGAKGLGNEARQAKWAPKGHSRRRAQAGGHSQNGLVERLIGSARHECTDHVIVFNEDHLRRILSNYANYYNEVRTHLSLGKDAPCTRPIERFGDIIAQPILGGLHHRYAVAGLTNTIASMTCGQIR
jgi:Integrase core domain